MGTDRNHVILAQQALTRGDPEGRWLRLLEVFLPVGLADMNQLQAATGFSRDQVNRLLEKFRQAAGGGQPMVTRVEVKVARPWLGARGAVIYQLAETGAALLRAAGHEEARACGLKEAVAIAHAAALLDVRLAALAAGLTVATETELCNDANEALRPDNLIGLLDGRPAMFELEQTARPELLRRIVEGVRRRAEFFTGETRAAGFTDHPRALRPAAQRHLGAHLAHLGEGGGGRGRRARWDAAFQPARHATGRIPGATRLARATGQRSLARPAQPRFAGGVCANPAAAERRSHWRSRSGHGDEKPGQTGG